MLKFSKLFKFLLILFLANNVYATVNNGAREKSKPKQIDDAIAIANELLGHYFIFCSGTIFRDATV